MPLTTDLEADCTFSPTHWSAIERLASPATDPRATQTALAEFCQNYWRPLYAFVRARGHSMHDAQDLTQAFFVFLIERQAFRSVDRRVGKFRNFLVAALKNFLADQYDRAAAKKRGGEMQLVALDEGALREYDCECARSKMKWPDEETLFRRRWAENLAARSLIAVEEFYAREKQRSVFDALKVFLTGSAEPLPSYPELARRLGMNESALRSAVSRLRARYREALRREVRGTVARDSEVDEELRELLRLLNGD